EKVDIDAARAVRQRRAVRREADEVVRDQRRTAGEEKDRAAAIAANDVVSDPDDVGAAAANAAKVAGDGVAVDDHRREGRAEADSRVADGDTVAGEAVDTQSLDDHLAGEIDEQAVARR